MTPPLCPPPAAHHPVSATHDQPPPPPPPHRIGAAIRLVSRSPPGLRRVEEPTVPARTLDPRAKGYARSGLSGGGGGDGGGGGVGCGRGRGGGGGGGHGKSSGGGGGGGGVAAPVIFSVAGTEQGVRKKKQQQQQQHVRAEHPPPPPPPPPRRRLSVESGEEGGRPDNFREASSYVWRVLVYLAFINPSLCFLNALYATLVLLVWLITYPIRYFLLTPSSSSSRSSSRSSSSASSCASPSPSTPGLAYLLLVHLRFISRRSTVLPLPADFSPARLVLVHVFGPFLALPLALTACALVFVWIYTEVVLGEKNDGRGAEYRGVVFVKERWEEYVLVALKPKELDLEGY